MCDEQRGRGVARCARPPVVESDLLLGQPVQLIGHRAMCCREPMRIVGECGGQAMCATLTASTAVPNISKGLVIPRSPGAICGRVAHDNVGTNPQTTGSSTSQAELMPCTRAAVLRAVT